MDDPLDIRCIACNASETECVLAGGCCEWCEHDDLADDDDDAEPESPDF